MTMQQIPIEFPEERRSSLINLRQVSITVEIPGDILTAGLLVSEVDRIAAQWGGAVSTSHTHLKCGTARVDLVPRGEVVWLNAAYSTGLPAMAVAKWSTPFTAKAWKEVKALCQNSRQCAIVSVIRQEDGFYRMKMAMTEEAYKNGNGKG